MRRTLIRISICLTLGLLTTLASALALAVWMPLEMYPRQTCFDFIADHRPWGAVQRAHRGAWNIWWDEYNPAYVTPPPPPKQFLTDSLRALAGRPAANQPDPALPSTPEAWMAYAREQRKTSRPRFPLQYRDTPPSWGTFAHGRSAPLQVQSGSDHGFGWPLPALWYRVHGIYVMNYSFGTEVVGGRLIHGEPDIRGYRFRALPYLPHYTGLILNSALFASLFFTVRFAPSSLRRRLRLCRGHCTRCGYDVLRNYTSPCPECGAGATAQSPAQ